MGKIDLIIPIYNRPEYTKACLDSLAAADHGAEIRPIIVNCGSRTKTSEVINEFVTGRDAQVVSLPRNMGFAEAINRGIDASKAETLCLLHNDTIVFDGWLGEMLEGLEDDVAAVVPSTNYANEAFFCDEARRDVFQPLKPSNKIFVSLEGLLAVKDATYPEGVGPFLEARRAISPRFTYSPDIATFCLLVKRHVFDEFPRFDPEFFPKGFEDKWWWKPIETDGLTCQKANRAWVHHFGNITSDGPGFCFPDIMKVNEERFKKKCLEGYAYNPMCQEHGKTEEKA